MDELTRNATGTTARRGFFRRIAGAMALGLAGLAPDPSRAQGAAAWPGGPDWPGPLKGRHRQLVDAYEINKGAPLAFAPTFLATSELPTASGVAATAVVVLRHNAFPLALGDEMWRKYKIGQSFKIDDPATVLYQAWNGCRSFRIALRTVRSLRATAMMASFGGFPGSKSFVEGLEAWCMASRNEGCDIKRVAYALAAAADRAVTAPYSAVVVEGSQAC